MISAPGAGVIAGAEGAGALATGVDAGGAATGAATACDLRPPSR